ncbi:MAG TPA: glycoside hydrolase family 16 protein [Anaerolineae bacterium]|nr:glycoside hydrolase family 16 protein [Anaerolineae bacterium]
MTKKRRNYGLIFLGGLILILLLAVQVEGARFSSAPFSQAERFVKSTTGPGQPATLVRTATPSPQKVQAIPGPPGPASDWLLTFSDEFSGTTLNHNTWATEYGFDTDCVVDTPPPPATPTYCNRSNNDEKEWYVDDAPRVENGVLKLEARKECLSDQSSTNYPPYSCDNFPYLSGMVSTHDRFSQLYGYFEARIKLLDIQGFWPAFWLIPQLPHPPSPDIEFFWPPEVDIMESRGQEPNMAYLNQHYSGEGVYPAPGSKLNNWSYGGGISGSYAAPVSLAEDFHLYAVDWEPDHLTWYIDGVAQFTSTTYLPPGEISLPEYPGDMHLILNLAVGGGGAGHVLPPDNSLPAALEVDYVRVYQKISARVYLPAINR